MPPGSGGGTKPSAGWVLSLAACNAQDANQNWTVTPGATVVHDASGLCVATPGGTGGGTLYLDGCTPGDSTQTWYAPTPETLTSTPAATDGGCAGWNNDNQDTTVGNPVVAWSCGSPPAWNERFFLPLVPDAASGSGPIQVLDSDGGLVGTCVSVTPSTNAQWTLPWRDAWSLQDY